MRNNYVGDVGDFYKYGLLRYLAGQTADDSSESLKLGVVWYLYVEPCRETDGLHLDYLNAKLQNKFRHYDPALYDSLNALITKNNRSVQEVQSQELLPVGTDYFAEPLSFSGMPKGTPTAINKRLEYRSEWLHRAMEVTEHAEIIFADPDNGLEIPSTAKHHDKGAKFCFYDELQEFWKRGQSLIIYQHKNLHQTADAQIKTRIAELAKYLPDAQIEHLYFPSYGGRIFFIASQPKHSAIISQRLKGFKQRWHNHIKQPQPSLFG